MVKQTNAPSSIQLDQNYPNPFNPATTIRFRIPSMSFVSLIVFDMLGREVAVLLQDDELQAGAYAIPFTAQHLSSGIYYYRLDTGTQQDIRSMVLVK